jgi:hypothetical protein
MAFCDRIFIHVTLLCFCALALPARATESGIQMLPPTDFSGDPCAGGNSGVLEWDGETSVKCIPGFVGLSNGNVGIGVTSPGATLVVRPSGAPLTNGMFAGSGGGINTWDLFANGGVYVGNGTSVNAYLQYWGNAFFGGPVGIGIRAPQGTLDIENGSNTATLCLNGGCNTLLPAEVCTTIGTLASFHPGCTGGTNTITAQGAFTAWCTSACNRYCGALGHKGGLINEYDGNTGDACCGCF